MFAGPARLDLVPFVAMQRFDTEEACVAVKEFVIRNHPYSKTKCVKDGVDSKDTKPQQ
jgi:hypothetical protein